MRNSIWLNIFGTITLFIAILGLVFRMDHSDFITFSFIFFTGAIITGEIERRIPKVSDY